MIRIYTQQLGAAEDFRKSLQRWNKQRSDKTQWATPKLGETPGAASSMDLEFIEEMTEQIRTRKAEIEELANAAERSCHEVWISKTPSLEDDIANALIVARSPVSQATTS